MLQAPPTVEITICPQGLLKALSLEPPNTTGMLIVAVWVPLLRVTVAPAVGSMAILYQPAGIVNDPFAAIVVNFGTLNDKFVII